MSLILILCTIIFTLFVIGFIATIYDDDIISALIFLAALLVFGTLMYLIASDMSITKDYDDFVEEYSITEKTQLNDSLYYTTQVGIDTTYYNVKTIVDTIK